jgi:hypothetical protein
MSNTKTFLDSRFDPASDKIIVIHYPPGGFGNFIFHVLSEFAAETAKFSTNKYFKFGSDGNSHRTNKYTNIYFHDPDVYEPTVHSGIDITNSTILILSDNGFGVERESLVKHRSLFPNAQFVKIVLDDLSMVVCYKTSYIKARKVSNFGNGEEFMDWHIKHYGNKIRDYEVREHYSTMYHQWHLGWMITDSDALNLSLTNLISNPYETLIALITELGLTVINSNKLNDLCKEWLNVNTDFFNVYHEWQKINTALDQNQSVPIDQLTLHGQGYINYCIEKKFNVIIPIYDYRNWFATTNEIHEMIKCLK